MDRKEFLASDGTPIFYRRWEGREGNDVILYLHGLESHTGWFVNRGDLLNQKGFHVYALDRRGWGNTRTERGHIESYSILVDDVKTAIAMARAEHPKSKVYLMALCWGAKIALIFTRDYQGMIDGLILLAPAIKTKVDLSFGEKLGVALNTLVNPKKLFRVPLEDHMFTRNEKYLEFIKNDELKLKKASARFFFETNKMNARLDSIAPRITLATLMFLAGDDVIVDNRKVEKWFSRVGSKDKTLKLCQGCSHSMEFEEEKSSLTAAIRDWIEDRKNA